MGLLIGASVITVFEALDMVFYNIIEKVMLRWKNKKNKNKISDYELAEQPTDDKLPEVEPI